MENSSIDVPALRERLQWDQGDLAEYLGLHRSSVSRLEKRIAQGKAVKGSVARLLRQLVDQTQQVGS